MLYRVETGPRAGLDDTQGRKTAQHLRKALNISVSGVRQIKVFTADGLDAAQVARLLDESIWHDPILQEASLEPLPLLDPAADWFVEVGFRPGVTDNEARTARDTAAMVLDIPRDSLRVYTAVQYRISSDKAAPLTLEQVDMLARDLLCNTLIQRYRIKSRQEWDAQPGFEAQAARVTGEINETVDTIALSAMNDEALTKASRENTWALNLKEMHSIRAQFSAQEEADRRKALGLPADPTDVEMEVLAQTWSEHCKHKIFASRINYTDAATGRSEVVDNLYKTCIRDATAMLREACQHGRDPDPLVLKGYMTVFLGRIYQNASFVPRSNSTSAMQQVLEYINAHFTEPLSLNTLAEALNFSKYYISRIFNQQLGYSFCHYLKYLRINHALSLLERDALSISDISYECGFESLRSFNRSFQEILETTPTAYRDSHRKQNTNAASPGSISVLDVCPL